MSLYDKEAEEFRLECELTAKANLEDGVIWNRIPNHPDYAVSSLGAVLSIRFGHVLIPKKHTKGYLTVCVIKDRVKTYAYIHRLVMCTFDPCANGKLQVNHIDGDRTNNRLSNLEWVTPKENIAHAIASGSFDDYWSNMKMTKGSDHPSSKLSWADRNAICSSIASTSYLVEKYKVCATTVRNLRRDHKRNIA